MKQFLKKIHVNIYTALALRITLMLCLYTLCRILFYLFNLHLFPEVGFKKMLVLVYGGLQFDISALFYINSLYLLLQVLPFNFRYTAIYQASSKWLFIVTNTIGLLANCIDFVYYPYTLKRTTSSVFKQFANEHNQASILLDFIRDFWYLWLMLFFIVWLLIKLYNNIQIKKTDFTKRVWINYCCKVLALAATTGIVIMGMRGGWRYSTRPITLNNAGEFVDRVEQMDIVLNTPFCIIRTVSRKSFARINYFSTNELETIYSPIHQPPKNSTAFKPLNVVILIIESLGKESVGALNKDILGSGYKGYTPFIDSLIKHSMVCTNAYANGRKSIDALPSVLAGIPSIQEPFILSFYANNHISSIAQMLKEKGYHTSFFHGAPNGSMGFSAFVHLAGIDNYYGKTEYNNDDDFDGRWGIWDEPFMQYFATQLNAFKQPFFSTLFSVSSHHPFIVPKRYKGVFAKGPLPVQECISYTDMALRKFFATAQKMPWYNNTIFVLTADHATVTNAPEYNNTIGTFAIPILFYYPGSSVAQQIQKPVQQIDIAPTILSLLHYDKPYFSFGFNALDNNEQNIIVHNNGNGYSLYMKDFLLLNDGKRSTALYNYKIDRLLQHNKVKDSTLLVTEMEKYLKAFIQQYSNRMIDNKLTLK